DEGVDDERLEVSAGEHPDALPKLAGGQRRVGRRATQQVPPFEHVHADVSDGEVVNGAEVRLPGPAVKQSGTGHPVVVNDLNVGVGRLDDVRLGVNGCHTHRTAGPGAATRQPG